MPKTVKVPVPGGSLHAVVDGEPTAPPILLVHASIVDSRAWESLTSPLVEGGYRVIRYDLRGLGRSTTERVEYSSRADLIAVLDKLRIGQAALVGNSAGGQIAIDTAIEYPDRIVAVATMGANISGFEPGVTPEEQAMLDEADRLEGAKRPDVAAIVEHDLRLWVDGPGQSPDRVRADIRDAVRKMDTANWQPGKPEPKPIPMRPTAEERLAELTMPVVAIAGTLDVSDVVATARHLAADAPNAQAIVWPDVAHMIAMERPERTADAIVDLLAPLPRWS